MIRTAIDFVLDPPLNISVLQCQVSSLYSPFVSVNKINDTKRNNSLEIGSKKADVFNRPE